MLVLLCGGVLSPAAVSNRKARGYSRSCRKGQALCSRAAAWGPKPNLTRVQHLSIPLSCPRGLPFLLLPPSPSKHAHRVMDRFPANGRLLKVYGRFLEYVRNDPWNASRCVRVLKS